MRPMTTINVREIALLFYTFVAKNNIIPVTANDHNHKMLEKLRTIHIVELVL